MNLSREWTMQRHAVRAAAVVALLLVAVAPRPGAALRVLHESAATDPGAPVVAGVTLLAWVLALWLSTAVAVSAAGTLPGVVGRCCAAVARRVTPAAVRRATEIALGVSLAAAVSPAGASFAASGPTIAHPAGAATTSAAGDTGGGAGATTAVTLDWPVPAPGATGPGAGPDPVVVRPGDCLWAIARTGLQAEGSAAPTVPEIARAWPRWWAANRAVLGNDPGLVRPEMHLTPPPV